MRRKKEIKQNKNTGFRKSALLKGQSNLLHQEKRLIRSSYVMEMQYVTTLER